MSNWKKVVFASDCFACEDCGEPVCPICQVHYAECACPGPAQDDEYEYRLDGEMMLARKLEDGDS